MSERLKACPYCGGYPAISGVPKNGILIWELRLGSKQKADGASCEFRTFEEACEEWNRRVKNEQSRND